MTDGEFFKEIPALESGPPTRMTSPDQFATLPRYRPQAQTHKNERSFLLDISDGDRASEGICYNTWPKARSDRRTSIMTLKTIVETEEEGLESSVSLHSGY